MGRAGWLHPFVISSTASATMILGMVVILHFVLEPRAANRFCNKVRNS